MPVRQTTDNTVTTPRLVVVLAFEGAQLLDVAGPVQTFASTNEIANKTAKGAHGVPYRVVVLSRRGGPVTTTSGLPLVTRPLARTLGKARIDTLIIPGGGGVQNAVKEAATVELGAPPGGVGSPDRVGLHRRVPVRGAGVLSGRRATTHWKFCARLDSSTRTSKLIQIRSMSTMSGFGPRPELPPESISASRWCRKISDESRDAGRAPSRRFSQPPRRPVAVFRAARSPVRGRRRQCANHFAPLHDWIAENVAGDLRVERLAQRRASARAISRELCREDGGHPGAHGGTDPIEAVRRSLKKTICRSKDCRAVRLQPGGAVRRAFARQSARRRRNTGSDFRALTRWPCLASALCRAGVPEMHLSDGSHPGPTAVIRGGTV